MSTNLKLSGIARQLLDDLEELHGVRLQPSTYDRAVQLVLDSFEAAEKASPDYVKKDSYVWPTALNACTGLTPRRWCSKCQQAYLPNTACPHFSPRRQGS